MEWQTRLAMLSAHVSSLGALQLLTIASLGLCAVLGTAMALQTRRHAQLRRELSMSAGSTAAEAQPAFDSHSLEGLGLSPIDRVFPLAAARAAHERSESGRARGKIVLELGSGPTP